MHMKLEEVLIRIWKVIRYALPYKARLYLSMFVEILSYGDSCHSGILISGSSFIFADEINHFKYYLTSSVPCQITYDLTNHIMVNLETIIALATINFYSRKKHVWVTFYGWKCLMILSMINKYFQSEKNSGLFFSPCFSLYTYVRILFYVIYVYIYIHLLLKEKQYIGVSILRWRMHIYLNFSTKCIPRGNRQSNFLQNHIVIEV